MHLRVKVVRGTIGTTTISAVPFHEVRRPGVAAMVGIVIEDVVPARVHPDKRTANDHSHNINEYSEAKQEQRICRSDALFAVPWHHADEVFRRRDDTIRPAPVVSHGCDQSLTAKRTTGVIAINQKHCAVWVKVHRWIDATLNIIEWCSLERCVVIKDPRVHQLEWS